MATKPKFAWTGSEERSVFEIISEDGVMSSKEIFHIIQNLCNILEIKNSEEMLQPHYFIEPHNIIVTSDGAVRFSAVNLPISKRDLYSPPEQNMSGEVVPSKDIYALGMLMLFMATGYENKTGLDTFIRDKTLRAVIERCTAFDPQTRVQNVRELYGLMKHSRRRLKRFLLGFLILVCISSAAGLAVHFYSLGKSTSEIDGTESGYASGYVSGYEKGFSDAPGVGIGDSPFRPDIGNLPGNISADAGAFAVRSEDEIFFIHEESIYRMNPYTKKVQLLVERAGVDNLNYYEGWLYYCTDKEVFRINPHSMKEETICDTRSGILYIANGEFYLDDTSDTGYLYKINIATREVKQLNGRTKYDCLNILDGQLYYADADKDYNLYKCDLDGDNISLINSNSCEWFCLYDNKIYGYAISYEDYERRIIDTSASFLVCMDLDGGSIQRLTNMPAYYINVTEAGLFYVAGNNRTLEWMSLDGSIRYTIVSSHTGPFNLVGRWIFYKNEEENGTLWRVRIDGSDNEKVDVV